MTLSFTSNQLQMTGLCLASVLLSACQASSIQPAITSLPAERDRQAILAMAGSYAVDFTFNETVAVRPGYQITEPYHASGTESVTVLEDTGTRIILQHVLVACDSGSSEQQPAQQTDEYKEALASDEQALVTSEEHCFPIKHWRQDWVFQDEIMLEFRGNNRWEKTRLTPQQVHGTWSQAVYQVDDSPRYEAYGSWRHDTNQSVWQSETTWRPLPRREHTVRDDYDVLVATNRHVITAHGWYHEQDNYKLDLSRNTEHPVIARESGLNRYLPVNAPELHLASEYMQETKLFWAQVRSYWEQQLDQHKALDIKSKVDDEAMYERMFELADEHSDAKLSTTNEIQRKINNTLAAYVQPVRSN